HGDRARSEGLYAGLDERAHVAVEAGQRRADGVFVRGEQPAEHRRRRDQALEAGSRRELGTGKESSMRTTLIGGLLALAFAAPLSAHHSISAEFDSNRPVTFTGVVTKIEWTNPHIYTHVEVKEPDGKVVEYRVEGGPPNALYRAGWRKDTLKVGD